MPKNIYPNANELINKRVYVYFNLHKKLFSVRSMDGDDYGRVIYHTDNIVLTNATFKVNANGRLKVLKERKKNVHAGIVGNVLNVEDYSIFNDLFIKVTYNPYKYDSFVIAECPQHKVEIADIVVMDKKQGIFIEEPTTDND